MTDPTISFIANHEPPLKDGLYTLALTHKLLSTSDNSVNQTFSKLHTLVVCGDRFTLPPDEIHKVFPPANTQGDYDSILPHVVFSRRTLPWERTPDRCNNKSWLAVMVFSQSEAPVATTGTLAGLYPSTTSDGAGTLPDGTYSYGSTTTSEKKFLEYGQKSTDACVWLDIAPNLFAAYAPSLADLAWNAHARLRTYKDGTSDDFAVVVANRLPPAGETVIAYLVSLEGLGDQLPQYDGTFASPPTWTAIRIVSLKSWSFRVGPLQASFSGVLKGLNSGIDSNSKETKDSQLRLPFAYRPAAATNAVPAAPFDSGYTVLAGQTAETAWYRSPFVPSTLTPSAADGAWSSRFLPANHATALEITVSATPTKDLSYSAAWQLGRLIALADKDFAAAQVSWKRDCRLKLNAAISQKNAATKGSRAKYAQSIRAIIASADQIKTYLGQSLTVTQTSMTNLYIPQELVDWLGKQALLNSVPFHYLVPDANMLPTESIRFFNVDPRWIASLLDGAWSLGREPATDRQNNPFWAFDTAYQPWAQLLAGTLKPSLPAGSASSELPSWPVSGILLNSRLLPGYWPGIEFTPDNDTIKILREDRLGPNTLLMLFNQTFKSLTIQEPPEGIHFGFDMDALGNISKKLRYVSEGNVYYPAGSMKTPPGGASPDPFVGSEVPSTTKAMTSIPQRIPDVIQLDLLAEQMEAALGTPVTTAEFALQLVEGVPSVKFTLP